MSKDLKDLKDLFVLLSKFLEEITKPLPPEVIAKMSKKVMEDMERDEAFQKSLTSEPTRLPR